MVNLTGVTNAQHLLLTLLGITDGPNALNFSVPMDVLVGDINGNGAVNAGDISVVKGLSGMPVSTSNFRSDVTANGAINSADVNLVKLQSGTSLP